MHFIVLVYKVFTHYYPDIFRVHSIFLEKQKYSLFSKLFSNCINLFEMLGQINFFALTKYFGTRQYIFRNCRKESEHEKDISTG